MIKLEVPLYCQECSSFNPIAEQTVFEASDLTGKVLRKIDIVIKCKHEDRCNNIYEYMEKTREKNKLYNEVKNQGGELI